MQIQAIIVINLVALLMLFWVLNLVRKKKLYAGYGVMFIFILLSVVLIVTLPGVFQILSQLVTMIFPSSGFLLIILSFITFLFIYVMTQLTIISDRLARLVQELAIRNSLNKNDSYLKKTDNSK